MSIEAADQALDRVNDWLLVHQVGVWRAVLGFNVMIWVIFIGMVIDWAT